MIDKEKAKAAIAEMCKNPDWKDVLANAPGAASLRVSLAFYASKNLAEMDQKQKYEYREFREMLERQLNAVELKYLAEEFKRMGVEAAATHYQELLSKKPQEEQAAAAEEYQEIVKNAAASKNKVSDFMAKYGPDAGKGGEDGGKEEGHAEKPGEGAVEEKPEDEQKPEGEETQDEAPAAPSVQAATESADPQQPKESSLPADSSAGSTTAEQEALPGFSDDDMKAFLDRGKAMLTKGIRMKAKPQA